jgi:hypothetical protein
MNLPASTLADYGPHSSSDLLSHYGFTSPSPDDASFSITIPMQIEGGDARASALLARLQATGTHPDVEPNGLHKFRFEVTACGVPTGCLEVLRVLCLADDEDASLAASGRPVSAANELLVYRTLLGFLSQLGPSHNAALAHADSLGGRPMAPNAATALVLVRGVQALQEALLRHVQAAEGRLLAWQQARRAPPAVADASGGTAAQTRVTVRGLQHPKAQRHNGKLAEVRFPNRGGCY